MGYCGNCETDYRLGLREITIAYGICSEEDLAIHNFGYSLRHFDVISGVVGQSLISEWYVWGWQYRELIKPSRRFVGLSGIA